MLEDYMVTVYELSGGAASPALKQNTVYLNSLGMPVTSDL